MVRQRLGGIRAASGSAGRFVSARASSAPPGDDLHAGQGSAIGVEEALVPGHALGGGLERL